MSSSRVIAAVALLAVPLGLASCSRGDEQTASTASTADAAPCPTKPVDVLVSVDQWGDIVSQLGGSCARVKILLASSSVDPHDYEPSPADAATFEGAQLVVINGAHYDEWASKLADTNKGANLTVLTVGDLVGVKDGDNPHRWYNPDNVKQVIDQITADYKKADPADSSFFDSQRNTVLSTNLKVYFDAIDQIKTNYAGTPVGASESIFAMLSPALGLNLLTPPGFLTAISEGSDPTAQDKATIDNQIKTKQIKVYVYNSQNATPDVQAQVDEAKAAGIPVSTITETLTPAGASFQDWQLAQLTALKQALGQATGK